MTAVLVLIARNWRILLPLVGVALVLAIIAYARHQGDRADRAIEAGRVAEHQADVNQNVADLTDKIHRTEAETERAADEGVKAVEQLPDAEKPLDPDRRSTLCAGLERVFHGSGGCEAEPHPDHAGSLP